MVNMIRVHKKIGIVFLLCMSFLRLAGDDALDQFANFDIDVATVAKFEENQPTRAYPPRPAGGPDVEAEARNLYDIFETLTEVVSEPIWYNTKAPSGRDILYLLPYKISALERGGFAFNLFFNMTDDMNVGARNLLNVDAIKNRDLLAEVLKFLTGPNLKISVSEAELTSLLALFQKISLQERKLGGVIQAGFVKGPFTVQLNTSVHMAERNFWLSPADRQMIKSLVGGGGASFDEQELIRYRYGLGDTRIKVGLNTLNMANLQMDVGFETIVPTSRFSYTPRYKAAGTQTVDSAQLFANDLFNVLKGVRDYLINPRMGNNGHFGFGCYFESKASVFRNLVNIWTRLSYDALLPAEEDRLMLNKRIVSMADVQTILGRIQAAGVGTPLEADAIADLRQVGSDFVKQYLFPSSYLTTVYPGGVFNAILAGSTDIKKMRFSLGYDFYMQQSEKIKKIHNTNVTLDQLRVEDAQASLAYQHKVFAEALYLKKFKRCDLWLGLGGDATVASQGIGKDWTAYAKGTASF